jgi:hypothetical protein
LRECGIKGVLIVDEESHLVQYLIDMCNRGLRLSPIKLKMKVCEIIRDRWTHFKNGISSGGWMRWWKCHYLELSLRSSQALEAARATGLCEENVTSFWRILQAHMITHLDAYGTTTNPVPRQVSYIPNHPCIAVVCL